LTKLNDLEHETEIKLAEVPIQWIPKFELYYPDLPGYPMVYVHGIKNSKRVYGFPAQVSFEYVDEKSRIPVITFVSNENLDENGELREFVKEELENRFGISGKFGIDEIKESCTDEKFKKFFEELWTYVRTVFGDYMPYGRFYERLFSIVRFVSAFQPKTGRQSEVRMVYNFVSIFGQRVEVKGKWNFLHFFVIPTYEDFMGKNFEEFPKFKKLYTAMEKIWKEFFTKEISINSFKIKSMKKGEGWSDYNKDTFINDVLKPLVSDRKIDGEDRHNIERLVDAFNRFPFRASFFISSVMNAHLCDYNQWTKDDFVYFYINTPKGDTQRLTRKTVGISQKVVACFLQQGFGKSEFIPIDTWIGSFHQHAIGIADEKKFFDSFSNLGKLERFFWFLAQAKKTNIRTFFDMLWCIRYGDTGNNEIREANPIACFECKVRKSCPSYDAIRNSKVLVVEPARDVLEDVLTPIKTRADGKQSGGKYKGKKIRDDEISIKANENGCKFVCFTENKIPKKIFVEVGNRRNRYWKLKDEFSGYLLQGEQYQLESGKEVITTNELIKEIEPFVPEDEAEAFDE